MTISVILTPSAGLWRGQAMRVWPVGCGRSCGGGGGWAFLGMISTMPREEVPAGEAVSYCRGLWGPLCLGVGSVCCTLWLAQWEVALVLTWAHSAMVSGTVWPGQPQTGLPGSEVSVRRLQDQEAQKPMIDHRPAPRDPQSQTWPCCSQVSRSAVGCGQPLQQDLPHFEHISTETRAT